ncbi:MFS transporter [Burkholderia sp. MSMB1589WGS]|uniref:MFS transporter n=1 Tax=Burkholderia sp. MSMB1589WGS TaxID=1636425 RepID=UPI0007B9F8FD|nr:MFS transporter [Burkholderia sp. MSMB1589WGS]
MPHLIVGVLSGLPGFAVSLRVGIGFYLSAVLELPAGVFADVFGHRRTLVYGYATCSIASLFLFLSCHYSHYSKVPSSLTLLIASSILSALGGALVSGCLQAFIQDFVDLHVSKSGLLGDEANELRAKALARSQAYGNFFSAFLPVLVLASVFGNYYFTRQSEWSLLIPVVVYGGLSMLFFFAKSEERTPPQANAFHRHCREHGRRLVQFAAELRHRESTSRIRFLLMLFRMVLSILTVIHVHTYLMVSQLRQIGLQDASWRAVLLGFLILAAFDLAHYPKGWIAPAVSKRLNANKLIYFSLTAQSVLALLAFVCFRSGHPIAAVIGFALFFNALYSPGNMTLQSKFLVEVPEHLRATVFSIVQIVVLVAYGSYSAMLTADGTGVDSPDRIFTQLMVLTMLVLALTIVCDAISAKRESSIGLDDAQA